MRSVDTAYEILRVHGEPILVHELIDQVLEHLQQEPEPRRMAQIYSDINLDVRFVYRGDGLWGLRDWSPQNGDSGGSRARSKSDEDGEELEEEEGWE